MNLGGHAGVSQAPRNQPCSTTLHPSLGNYRAGDKCKLLVVQVGVPRSTCAHSGGGLSHLVECEAKRIEQDQYSVVG